MKFKKGDKVRIKKEFFSKISKESHNKIFTIKSIYFNKRINKECVWVETEKDLDYVKKHGLCHRGFGAQALELAIDNNHPHTKIFK